MTPSFMSKRSDSTKRSHHASKFKMNRHALANEAFGYKEMIAPYLPSKSTLESSLHLARSHSLNKHSGDESMSSSASAPLPRPVSVAGFENVSPRNSRVAETPSVSVGTVTPDLHRHPTFNIDSKNDAQQAAAQVPKYDGTEPVFISPRQRPTSEAHGARPSSPSTDMLHRKSNPATGAYRDLSKGSVVETDQEGNMAEPTIHPGIASPQLSHSSGFHQPLPNLEMPGLNAAAGFLPHEGRSQKLPQFTSPVLTFDPDASAQWNHDMSGQVTGFAVASSKRNADFHALFPTLPEDDYLIETYTCAVNRDLLIQGRMYVSEAHLAFHSNIFGWVTSIVVPFAEIVSIEKRNTAYLIPNAISVRTLHARYLFSSLVSRDLTYSMLVCIWRMSTPSEAAQQVAKALSDESDEEAASENEEHDSEQAKNAASGDAAGSDDDTDASVSTSDKLPNVGSKIMTKREKLRRHLSKARKKIRNSNTIGAGVSGGADDSDSEESDSSMSDSAPNENEEHAETTCDCEKKHAHLDHVVLDDVFNATPQQVFDLMFVDDFMKRFLEDNQMLQDVQIGEWRSGEDASPEATATRSVTYVKPLHGPIGPKQTKCLITDEQLHIDFDDFCTAVTTTRTPEVPSGNNFAVRTRLCFTWAEHGRTRLYVTCTVDWTGRSMIKSVIDKASVDGQKDYFHAFADSVRQYIIDHPKVYGKRRASASKAHKVEKIVNENTNPRDRADSIGSQLQNAMPSTSVVVLTTLIIVLLISHVWVYLRGAPGAMRDPHNPHRLISTARPKQLTMRQAKVILQDEVQQLLDTLANSRRVTEEIELELRELQEYIHEQTKLEETSKRKNGGDHV